VRIAFTGSGGTGKTTTLKEVNKILKYPVIKEGVREYMAQNNIEHLRELGVDGTMKMQNWLLDEKEVSEKQTDFIADRTTVDNFVYALEWLGREDELQDEVSKYRDRCMGHAANHYDLIVIFPWGQFPLEDDGVRSAKPMYQFKVQMLIERLVQQLIGNVAVHMLQATDLDGRVREILRITEQLHDSIISAKATEAGIIH
jgi:nicotinamide riboside kinase